MKHYHGTPLGGDREGVARFAAGRCCFVSWARPEDLPVVADVARTFALDNGAFTFWKQGNTPESWADYYAFVLRWSRHPAFDFAVIPDVIDGDEAANDALCREWMKRSDLTHVRACPVWHYHESLDRLKRLVEGWPLVALGSSGQYSTPGSDIWWRRTAEAMEICCDTNGVPQTQLHGLRMLSPAIVERLPLSSADSTNAVRNAASVRRFGIYTPPTKAQRAAVIADRLEANHSPAVWQYEDQLELFTMTGDA